MTRATFTHEETVLTPETNIASINRAMGLEISVARKRNHLPLATLATHVSFGTNARALALCEQGYLPVSTLQFVNICETIGVAAPEILGRAVRRHHAFVEQLQVRVDLHLVHHSTRTRFFALKPWAHRQLSAHPAALMVDLPPTTVSSLANRIDLPHHDVAQHLAGCYAAT